MAQVILWELCGKLELRKDEKYYNHQPQPVYESTYNKLLLDFTVQTVNKIEHNKPDIVVLDKIEQKRMIIDVACPFDIRVNYERKRKFRTTKT